MQDEPKPEKPLNQDERKPQPAIAKQDQSAKQQEKKFDGYLSEVVDIAGRRTGIYGEIKQAMCKILEGKDKGRVIRRNVAGSIRIGDIMRLPDTSREDKPIRSR